MTSTITTTSAAADPADQILRLTAATRHAALDLHADVADTGRLPELLDAVWELQGVLDEFVAVLLDRALPRQAVRLRLMQHWARDREVRACATSQAGQEAAPGPGRGR